MKQITFLLCFVATFKMYAQCEVNGKVPEEFVRNRYTPSSMIYGHPYTMFNKRDGFNLKEEIQRIRFEIETEGNMPEEDGSRIIFESYKSIYNSAISAMPADSNPEESSADPSNLALWTKYNAFVLLIGLDGTLDEINRNEFVSRVEAGFANMNCEGTRKEGKVIIFANTAICWIQAYDLYKTAIRIADPNLSSDFDRNRADSGPRDKMRIMAKQLYDNSMGDMWDWWGPVNHPSGYKKNHAVIPASAMLLCGIVLNDAGVRGIRARWSPKKWAKAGMEGIDDGLFHGKHSLSRDVPLTSPDGNAGFNEGPTL